MRGPPLIRFNMLALDDIEPADSRTDMNADPLGIFRRDFQARRLHRFVRGRQREVDEAAHLLSSFFSTNCSGSKFLTSAAIWQA